MSAFEWHVPATIADALEFADRYRDDAQFVAGGTAVVLLFKSGLVQRGHAISLHRIEALRGINLEGEGGLRIGSLTTHREIERSQIVRAHSPLLATACANVATVRIRNQATIGGNLAHADPAQDPAPALIALGARIIVTGLEGTRTVATEDLFTDLFETTLSPSELIVEVRIPQATVTSRSIYLKFLPRTEDDYATVSVAAAATGDVAEDLRVRIGLGAVGSTPIRARAAEDVVNGHSFSDDLVAAAADAAVAATNPIEDGRGSAEYKREMARVFTARALRAVALNS